MIDCNYCTCKLFDGFAGGGGGGWFKSSLPMAVPIGGFWFNK